MAGRTFASRPGHWQPGTASPVYVLGHEELQAAAAAALGPTRLERYRERLHGWAQEYRARGWPAGTPEYLLRGYFRLLLDAADLPRLTDCATDRARHDRMLDITGGDAAALAEITDVQDLMLRLEDYDLPVLARLNVHRSRLADRNAHVPSSLADGMGRHWPPGPRRGAGPVDHRPGQAGAGAGGPGGAVADAGDLDRAEALARSITDPDQQALGAGGPGPGGGGRR